MASMSKRIQMSRGSRARRPQGQVRQSQVISTFGPGAMMDLPKHSVLVAGLEYWTAGGEDVYEPRLTEKLKLLLDVPAIQLRTPPPDNEDPTSPPTGITVWQFPEWFITQDVTAANGQGFRSRMLVHRRELTRNRFMDENKKLRP